MSGLLIFTPYICIPLLMSLIFRKLKITPKALTYVLTGLIIFFYPFVLLRLDEYFNPPPPGPRCGLPEAALLFCNTLFLLPITLFLQFMFNRMFP